MTTSLVPSLREIAEGTKIPKATLLFFRERLKLELHQALLREFVRQERAGLVTRKKLAERIGKHPEQITRLLASPGNWTLGTLSDLFLGMGTEPTFGSRRIVQHPALVDQTTGLPPERVAASAASASQGEPHDEILRLLGKQSGLSRQIRDALTPPSGNVAKTAGLRIPV